MPTCFRLLHVQEWHLALLLDASSWAAHGWWFLRLLVGADLDRLAPKVLHDLASLVSTAAERQLCLHSGRGGQSLSPGFAQATRLSTDLLMHSAVSFDELMAALLTAAGTCLGPKTEAHLRHWVAQRVRRWFAAEAAAQCTAVSLHNFAQLRCSHALWAPAAGISSESSPVCPHVWVQVSIWSAVSVLPCPADFDNLGLLQDCARLMHAASIKIEAMGSQQRAAATANAAQQAALHKAAEKQQQAADVSLAARAAEQAAAELLADEEAAHRAASKAAAKKQRQRERKQVRPCWCWLCCQASS